jgi:hypothetical protein
MDGFSPYRQDQVNSSMLRICALALTYTIRHTTHGTRYTAHDTRVYIVYIPLKIFEWLGQYVGKRLYFVGKEPIPDLNLPLNGTKSSGGQLFLDSERCAPSPSRLASSAALTSFALHAREKAPGRLPVDGR